LSPGPSGVKSFDLMPAMKPQVPTGAIDAASVVEAKRGVGSGPTRSAAGRVQSGSEHDGLAELRAASLDETFVALKSRAEEALATDRVDRPHLRYDASVQRMRDALHNQEDLSAEVRVSHRDTETTAMKS
jgi:hypothetical protein